MTGLCTPWAWRSKRREVHLARLAFAAVGMGFVLWLIAAELLIIGSICECCTGVHIITFALFICIDHARSRGCSGGPSAESLSHPLVPRQEIVFGAGGSVRPRERRGERCTSAS